MKTKGIISAIIIASLTLIAVGCSSGTDETAQTSSVTDTVGYPLTVSNYGREITIDKKPERVLTFGPNCTELFTALGLNDYIIGTTLNNHSRGPLPEYEDDISKIPELNYGSATREAVISSGADFIYGIDWEFGSEGLDIAELEGYGMNVYVNSATSVEEQYNEITDIGKIFGVEEKAEAFVNDQKSRILEVQNKIGSREKPDVLVYDSGNDGVFTAGGSNFETTLISLAGGNNIFSDITDKQWTTVSYEEVLSRNPDIIIVHDYDTPSAEEKIKEIKANSVLSQLDCVKNDRFITIDLESVLPGDRMAYSIEKLATGFFPDAF